jgi:hypothetical protein
MAVSTVELDAAAQLLAGKLGVDNAVDKWTVLYDRKYDVSQRLETDWGVRGLCSHMRWEGFVDTAEAKLDLPQGRISVTVHEGDSCLERDCPFHVWGVDFDYYVPDVEGVVMDAAQRLAATRELHVKPYTMHLSCLKLLVAVSLVYLDVHATPRLRPPAPAATASLLPCDVLFGVMAYLGDCDRRAAACVCRGWRDVAGDPLLATATSRLAARLRDVTRSWGPIETTPCGVVIALALARRWFGEAASVG